MVQNRDDEDYNPFAAPASDLSPEPFLVTSSDFEYAGFWARLGATMVDGIVIRIVETVIGLIMVGVIRSTPPAQRAIFELLSAILSIVWVWLYFALQESSEAEATLGKRLLKLRVLDLSGKRLTFGRATGRHFGKFISLLTLMIGYLMQPFTARKQALHDIMAGTIVVKGGSSLRPQNEAPPDLATWGQSRE